MRRFLYGLIFFAIGIVYFWLPWVISLATKIDSLTVVFIGVPIFLISLKLYFVIKSRCCAMYLRKMLFIFTMIMPLVANFLISIISVLVLRYARFDDRSNLFDCFDIFLFSILVLTIDILLLSWTVKISKDDIHMEKIDFKGKKLQKDVNDKQTYLNITFRKAKKSDVQTIAKLFNDVTENLIENKIFQWDDKYPSTPEIKADIENSELYVGEISSKIAVVFTLNQRFDEQYLNGYWQYIGKNYYVVHRLCVSPESQNQGIGTKTMSFIEDLLKKNECKAIKLDVFSENPSALHFYDKLGYKTVGVAYWRKGKYYLFEKDLKEHKYKRRY